MSAVPCKSESELDRLGTGELVAYIQEHKRFGHPDCVRRAMGVLAFRYMDFVRAKVSEKVDRQDVDDLASQVLESALRSAFDGKTVGEFVNWLKVITSRRIADHYGRPGLEEEPLPEEHEGEEQIWGHATAAGDGFVDEIAYREIAGRLLEELSLVHRMVVRCYGPVELGFDNLSAAETRKQVEATHVGETMSEDNVHKIWSRFRGKLAGELRLG